LQLLLSLLCSVVVDQVKKLAADFDFLTFIIY